MKKGFLLLGIFLLSAGAMNAQDKKVNKKDKAAVQQTSTQAAVATPAGGSAAQATAAPATPGADASIVFNKESHSFGTVAEGPAAEYQFSFKNTGKVPVAIQRVQASCGCTTPDWTHEPVAPGKSGMVKASYGTMGRPGEFHKTLTVYYTVGNDQNSQMKVLAIDGNVEKAPTSSVPENGSMMKTN